MAGGRERFVLLGFWRQQRLVVVERVLPSSGPYTPLFLDATTVTPGKQMEAIRESVEDYEYFVMLRDAVAAARASGRGGAATDRAESLLKTGPARVLEGATAESLKWHVPKDRGRADRVRLEVLAAIAELAGK